MKQLSTLLLLSFCFNIWSQTPFIHEKRDHIWLMGSTGNAPPPEWGGTRIDFNFNPPLVSEDPKDMGFWDYNSSMCDPDGNLLFYNDFSFIANADHDTLVNGSGLNAVGGGANWLTLQGCISLPHPGDENLYYLIHKDLEFFPNGIEGIPYVATGLYATLIDMSNGGEVLEKNTLIVADTLDEGKVSAVRHANGRDWWILTRKFNSTKYCRLLLDPNGLHLLEDQEIGSTTIIPGFGTSEFSPDGTKYAVMNAVSFGPEGQWVFYFDFDRCTGLLSNYREHQFFVEVWHAQSLTFSPNSRFLYVNDTHKVWQFDTWEDNFFSSADTIGWVDLNEDCFNEQMKLGPDGKIYITCRANLSVMNVIHNPNEGGLAANYEQNGLILPTRGSNVPNTANYKLGPIDGSPCDTLGIDNVVVSTEDVVKDLESSFTISPNPASDIFTLKCNHSVKNNTKIILTDAVGKHVINQTLGSIKMEHEIDVSRLINGIYFYTVESNSRVLSVGKLVVYH